MRMSLLRVSFLAVLVGASAFRISSSRRQDCPNVTTQPDFDLEAYISRRWYVQQNMITTISPANGNNCITAQYTRKASPTFWGWTITVENRAVRDNGEAFGGEICSRVVDEANPAKLAVSPCFLPTFAGGPYWVLAHDEEEGYALVSGGQPTIRTENGCRTGTGVNNAGLWIFTREPEASDELVAKVRGLAQTQGFDLSVLVDVRQEGCTYS